MQDRRRYLTAMSCLNDMGLPALVVKPTEIFHTSPKLDFLHCGQLAKAAEQSGTVGSPLCLRSCRISMTPVFSIEGDLRHKRSCTRAPLVSSRLVAREAQREM